MAETTITLEFLAQLSQRQLDEMRELRREVADIRTLSLQNHDYSRRLDRRMGELKDDTETMLKAELMGRFAHLETKLEHMLQPINERLLALDKLEKRVAALDAARS